MAGFFRSLFDKALGPKTSKNKHPIRHIEGAEQILIDSSVLCCPVCYEVYSSVPGNLQCGHTFCSSCIRNITVCLPDINDATHEKILCPMCRADCYTRRTHKNFLVEDLLATVSAIEPEGAELEKAKNATIRLAKQRLENRCRELEQMNNRLTKEINDMKKRDESYRMIFAAFLAYLIFYTFYQAVM